MEEQSVESFWTRKEEERNSRLLLASFATYVKGGPELKKKVMGLFYLMENGFYFENYEKDNTILGVVRVKEHFKRINLEIPLTSIEDVTDLKGRRGNEKSGFSRKLLYFLTFVPRGLKIVACTKSGQRRTYLFECAEDPLKFCRHYYAFSKGKGERV